MPEIIPIDVIVAAYNAERFLRRAVESVWATGYPSLRVYMVDDGSTDCTLEVATTLALESGGRCEVLRHPSGVNRGVSASRNLGIRAGQAPWIAFLDADDTVNSWRFDHSTKILENDISVDAVFETAALRFDNDNERASWPSNSKVFGITEELVGDELLKSLINGQPWPTSAILFRRALLDRTGMFDEGLTIAEDCNLWMRMAVAGKVMPGNLSAPVSQYIRRSGSLYQPALERKVDYIRALASFSRWLKRSDSCIAKYDFVERVIINWLDNALIQLRESGRGDLVGKLVAMVVVNLPKLAFSRRFLSHIGFCTWESIMRMAANRS